MSYSNATRSLAECYKQPKIHRREIQRAVYESSVTFWAFRTLSLAGQLGGKKMRKEAKMKEGELIKPNRTASDLHVQ